MSKTGAKPEARVASVGCYGCDAKIPLSNNFTPGTFGPMQALTPTSEGTPVVYRTFTNHSGQSVYYTIAGPRSMQLTMQGVRVTKYDGHCTSNGLGGCTEDYTCAFIVQFRFTAWIENTQDTTLFPNINMDNPWGGSSQTVGPTEKKAGKIPADDIQPEATWVQADYVVEFAEGPGCGMTVRKSLTVDSIVHDNTLGLPSGAFGPPLVIELACGSCDTVPEDQTGSSAPVSVPPVGLPP